MTEAHLARVTGLTPYTLLRLHALGLLPAWCRLPRPGRGGWMIYSLAEVLLAKVAHAFTRLGAAASDAAPLLLVLRSLPLSEREALVDRTVLVRWAAGTTRLDFHLEGEIPVIPGVEPLLFRLRDLLSDDAAEPQGAGT